MIAVFEWGWEKDEAFQMRFRSWRLTLEIYQVLEAIFRQALLDDKCGAGYRYGIESRDAEFSIKGKSPQEYFDYIQSYISNHEAAKKDRYQAACEYFKRFPIESDSPLGQLQTDLIQRAGAIDKNGNPLGVALWDKTVDGIFVQPTVRV
ncbi:MAG: hypothetical protein HC883_01520 [Bdellovibrionaceae bacterium]|nr:hypothetical protein [Pseudobdellovibrionaceae bacterium]